MSTFIKVALWISAIITLLFSLLLGLIGVALWIIMWALFLVIFRPWKTIRSLSADPAGQERKNIAWAERTMANAEKLDSKTEAMKADIARMKEERIARREMRRGSRAED